MRCFWQNNHDYENRAITFFSARENPKWVLPSKKREGIALFFCFRIAGRMLRIQNDVKFRFRHTRLLLSSGVYDNSFAACFTLRYDFKQSAKTGKYNDLPIFVLRQGIYQFPTKAGMRFTSLTSLSSNSTLCRICRFCPI